MSVFTSIALGAAPNDGNGEEARAAGQIINDNFALSANKTEDNIFSGDNTFNGFFGLGAPEDLTISSGAITATKSNIKVAGEGASADQLDTINSAAADGDIIILRTQTDTITVSEVGNIQLESATIVMDSNSERLMLQFSGTNWIQISYADNNA